MELNLAGFFSLVFAGLFILAVLACILAVPVAILVGAEFLLEAI